MELRHCVHEPAYLKFYLDGIKYKTVNMKQERNGFDYTVSKLLPVSR